MTVPGSVRRVADAVLYEGYLLWPYRRSALKNQRRWTFGGVYPEAWSVATGGTDASMMQTACLVELEGDAPVDVCVRFLHVVERRMVDAAFRPVDELVVGDERYLAWEEATEREVGTSVAVGGPAARVPIDVPAGETVEPLGEVGAIVRSWRALRGAVDVRTERLGPRLHRIEVRIANTAPWHGGSRDEALRQSFLSTHSILRAEGGAFVSIMDPPAALRAAAEACRNVGTWPVLAGEEGDRHLVLSSPIVLYDWPRVAPESPGDLFDATEIDQLLVLSVLALSDEEQREMRASDPRARAILERCAALSDDDRARLHGAIRSLRPVGER